MISPSAAITCGQPPAQADLSPKSTSLNVIGAAETATPDEIMKMAARAGRNRKTRIGSSLRSDRDSGKAKP